MANKLRFTKSSLSELPPARPRKRDYYLDDKVNGLGIAVTPKGVKSFFVVRRIGSNTKRITIGRFPDITVDNARTKAYEVLRDIALGIDPIKAKKAARSAKITLSEAFEEYLLSRPNLKPLTIKDYRKAITESFSDWLSTPLSEITKDKVRARHRFRGNKSKARANNAMRVLRAVFNFAAEVYEDEKGNSLYPINPVSVLSKTRSWYEVKRKQTYIEKSRLPAWFDAVNQLDKVYNDDLSFEVKNYLLFLLFTGARREEALTLKWDCVDFNEKQITFLNTKNKLDHKIPMNSFVFDLLVRLKPRSNSDFIFPGKGPSGRIISPDKQIKRVSSICGFHFSSHDLRRTFITIGESLDISHYSLKRLVNHKTGITSDVTAGYIISDQSRLLKASQKICSCILNLVNCENSSKILLSMPR